MMRRILRGVAATVFLLSLSSAAVAQDTAKKSQFLFGVGSTLPQGDFADGADNGYHAALGQRTLLGQSAFGIRSDLMYAKGDIAGSVPGMSATWSIATLAVGFQAEARSGTVRPYVLGQWALYEVTGKASYQGQAFSESMKKGGLSAGAGVQFALGGLKLHAEARYGYMTGSGTSMKFVPLTFGLTF